MHVKPLINPLDFKPYFVLYSAIPCHKFGLQNLTSVNYFGFRRMLQQFGTNIQYMNNPSNVGFEAGVFFPGLTHCREPYPVTGKSARQPGCISRSNGVRRYSRDNSIVGKAPPGTTAPPQNIAPPGNTDTG